MRKPTLFLTLAVLCLCVGACSEDDPVKPEEFSVTFQVQDADNNPVAGLRVGLVNDHDYFQDGAAYDKASVALRFQVPIPVDVRYTIEDIEGQEIRTLVEGGMMAGVHQLVWDGMDDDRIHQPSGRYTAHMVATEIGTGLFMWEDRTDMLLSMLDSSRVPAGYTDANGRLVLRDMKLFPHLYDRPSLTATDETAEILGEFDLTSTMRVSLTDTATGHSTRYLLDVTGGGLLDISWGPSPILEALESPERDSGTGRGPLIHIGPPPPLAEFELELPYPNPFN